TLHVAAGATADLNSNSFTATGLSGAGTLELGSATLTVNTAGATAFAGPINGSGSVTKLGTNVLTLSGASTFSNELNVDAGRVNLTSTTAAGTAFINVAEGASIQIGKTLGNFVNLYGGSVSTQTGDNLGSGVW